MPEAEPWLRDSTTLVLRRIRMDLEGWDLLGRAERELVVGRRLDTGAPLTGTSRTRRAGLRRPARQRAHRHPRLRAPDPGPRRRRQPEDPAPPYNYDGAPAADGTADSGLIFASYQADIARQFLPIQQRLAEADLLNEWTVPIGSAVFAIPPGCPNRATGSAGNCSNSTVQPTAESAPP